MTFCYLVIVLSVSSVRSENRGAWLSEAAALLTCDSLDSWNEIENTFFNVLMLREP